MKSKYPESPLQIVGKIALAQDSTPKMKEEEQ